MQAIVDIDSEAAAAAHLYGLPTDQFVAARNELVRRLRSEGERELAAAIALLRRPTVLAAELNRVLRLSPPMVAELIDCADALRADHQLVLEGETVDVSSRHRAHRQAAAELAELAERDQGTIQQALEAASLDEDLHPQLRAATFATEPAPQTGFDLLTPTATVSSLSEARKKRQARQRDRDRAEAEASETRLRRRRTKDEAGDDGAPPAGAEQQGQDEPADDDTDDGAGPDPDDYEVAEARKGLRLANRRVEATQASHRKAEERVTNLEQQLTAARSHVGDAKTKLTAAEGARERARDRLRNLGADPESGEDD